MFTMCSLIMHAWLEIFCKMIAFIIEEDHGIFHDHQSRFLEIEDSPTL